MRRALGWILWGGWAIGLALGAQDVALRETFAEAKALWATQGDRDGATARFERVLAALEPTARSLTGENLRMLCETYNWLAVLDDRNPARKAKVQAHLEAILELDPEFEIDRNLSNARIQAAFDALRSQKLVRVTWTLQPEGGVLIVDDQPRPAGSVPRYLRPGLRTLTYRKPGYEPLVQTVELSPKAPKTLTFELRRVSSTVTLHSIPSGAEVLLDGKPLGRTQGMASGAYRSLAEKVGVSVEQMSEPFVIEGLTEGAHRLELRAPCHRTRRLDLDPSFSSPLADHLLEPVKLEPSRGLLTVQSPVPGELFLDGKPLGMVPVKELAVCAGRHELEVRYPAGGFRQTVEVAEGATVSMEARPKPRLAILGLGSDDTGFAGRERFLAQLAALEERLTQVSVLKAREGETPEQAEARVKAEGSAEVWLRAQPVRVGATHAVDLVLTTAQGESETFRVKPLEEDPLADLVARMNAVPVETRHFAGIVLVDVPGQPGPWVLSVDPEAQAAGLEPHKPILEAGGAPVTTVAEFQARLEQAGTSLEVRQEPGGALRTLTLREAIVELPVASKALCYPVLLADLRLRSLGAKGEEAGRLRLHQALALLHFRRYDRALEVLREVRGLGASWVGQGTCDYYVGLCLQRLGSAYATEAAQAFQRVLQMPRATLFGPEGPQVAPLARWALDELNP